ncbi:P-loop containing nucleoside triphosphate hydrolase [Phytophthora cactorum]|nr:P-loop containing nucleoside triphosphate hydrolase [Phytophthora cactorum]
MSVLFGKRRRASAPKLPSEESKPAVENASNVLISFLNLGVDPWLVKRCELLGIRHPTPTGSGKTAAFALPILHTLSKDPYGPYALVLTPTRELAFQIADQFNAFGSSMAVRYMLKQSLTLQQRPHIIVATPGRFRDHLLRVEPPNISLVKYVVLDEADRLLDVSFAKDLSFIFDKLPTKRQTLLLEQTSLSDNAFRFDATPSVKTVATLKQFYLFIPAQVKMTYLMYLMKMLDPTDDDDEKSRAVASWSKAQGQEGSGSGEAAGGRHPSKRQLRSMMIFVSTCKMASSVTLHSMMSQNRRLAALGLDIPEVDVVLNFDLPRDADDYITAWVVRPVPVAANIEAKVGKKMDDYESEAPEKKVLKLLNDVTTASRIAKMKLTERGFDDKVHARKTKRQEQHNKKHKISSNKQ